MTRDYVAVETRIKTSRVVNTTLDRCRVFTRESVFEEFGLLFSPWGTFGSNIVQKVLTFLWAWGNELQMDGSLQSLHTVKPFYWCDRVWEAVNDEDASVYSENVEFMPALLVKIPELILIVTHKVDVRIDFSQATRSGNGNQDNSPVWVRTATVRRKIRKFISIIDA